MLCVCISARERVGSPAGPGGGGEMGCTDKEDTGAERGARQRGPQALRRRVACSPSQHHAAVYKWLRCARGSSRDTHPLPSTFLSAVMPNVRFGLKLRRGDGGSATRSPENYYMV